MYIYICTYAPTTHWILLFSTSSSIFGKAELPKFFREHHGHLDLRTWHWRETAKTASKRPRKKRQRQTLLEIHRNSIYRSIDLSVYPSLHSYTRRYSTSIRNAYAYINTYIIYHIYKGIYIYRYINIYIYINIYHIQYTQSLPIFSHDSPSPMINNPIHLAWWAIQQKLLGQHIGHLVEERHKHGQIQRICFPLGLSSDLTSDRDFEGWWMKMGDLWQIDGGSMRI